MKNNKTHRWSTVTNFEELKEEVLQRYQENFGVDVEVSKIRCDFKHNGHRRSNQQWLKIKEPGQIGFQEFITIYGAFTQRAFYLVEDLQDPSLTGYLEADNLEKLFEKMKLWYTGNFEKLGARS